ncbi:MAG: protein kinase [Sandaracinus sp.]
MDQVASSLVGQLVGGRFRVICSIAAGGMGAVYEARDEQLGRRVALKVIRGELLGDPVARARFRREALATAAITHPALVTLYDVALDGDPAYFVMELIDGATLDAVLHREVRLHWPRALRLGLDVLDALEALHGAGIVHRDLKPSNLMIVGEGERERCRVIDLGVARLLTAPADDARTASGVAVGTPAYMAPEQLAGERVGPSADLYAVGLVLYKAITGLHPFSTSAITSDAALPRGGAIEPLQVLAPDVPTEVNVLVETMLSRAIARRPPSAAAAARELRAILARVASTAPIAHQRPAAASEISTPGASDVGWRAAPVPRAQDEVPTRGAPVTARASGTATHARAGLDTRLLAIAIAVAMSTAAISALTWRAMQPEDPPTNTSAAPSPPIVTAPITTETPDVELPRGVDVAALPAPATPPHAATPHGHAPASQPPSGEVAPAQPTPPQPPIEPSPAEGEPAVDERRAEGAIPATETPSPSIPEGPPPLASSPGMRPATRLRVQYLGSGGRTDGAAISARLDAQIGQCIDPSRHYANQTLASLRVTIDADGAVRDIVPSAWEGTAEERACVERAIRAAPWPPGQRRETYVRINPLR